MCINMFYVLEVSNIYPTSFLSRPHLGELDHSSMEIKMLPHHERPNFIPL